jgi:hypothetical protein
MYVIVKLDMKILEMLVSFTRKQYLYARTLSPHKMIFKYEMEIMLSGLFARIKCCVSRNTNICLANSNDMIPKYFGLFDY